MIRRSNTSPGTSPGYLHRFRCAAVFPAAALTAVLTLAVPSVAQLSLNPQPLPDAPESHLLSSSSAEAGESSARAVVVPRPVPVPRQAERLHRVIEPDEIGQPLSAVDKFELGVVHSVAPLAVSGWFVSSGIGQLTGMPHYGSDRGAFGRRLEAGGLRSITTTPLSVGIAASAFHQDPRYYRMGRGHSVGSRLAYAATRSFITRTDAGAQAPNLWLPTGLLAGDALTNTYYPTRDQGVRPTFVTFGWAMEGAVISDLFREFLPEALHPHTGLPKG